MADLVRSQCFRIELLDDGNYRIVAQHSGKVLDVKDGSLENGAPLIQWDWHGGDNQRFSIEKMADGFVRFIAKHSGKAAIHVHGGGVESGAAITQWQLVNQDNLLFRIVTLPDGSARIIGKASNKVIAVRDGALDSGTGLIQTDPLD